MLKMTYNQILEYFENNQQNRLKEKINLLHPADSAQIINELPSEYQFTAFSLLNDENASDILPDLYDELREDILEKMQQNRLVKIIDEMETDEAADIIGELEEDVSKKLLEKIDKEDSEDIKQLLKYDEESAGGLMQTEIIAVNQEMKRDEIIEYIRENYEEVENIHYIFVKDDDNKLIGLLEVTHLLLAKPQRKAKDIMDKNVISAQVDLDQEQVAHIFRKYDIYILPVVDKENHLLGRITVDDIIDVIDEEASEDVYKMVGLESEDRVFSKPIESSKKRTPWLILNMFTAILAASVVGLFEGVIGKYVVLAVFLPIVAGMGGNAATQTLTVITRGIALGELTLHNTKKAILKEFIVGIINGIVFGIIAYMVAYIWRGNPIIGVILGVAMVVNMIIAALFGALIPIVMKSLKIDPALASTVIITTLTDVGGFAAFLGLATILL